MKRTLIAIALSLGFANAALAYDNVFDEPYWKQALDRSAGQTAIKQDASGASIQAQTEAAKADLDRAGFPQYNY